MGSFKLNYMLPTWIQKKGVMMLKKNPQFWTRQESRIGFPDALKSHTYIIGCLFTNKKNPISISKQSYSKVDCHLLVVKQHLLKNPTWHYYLGILYQIYINVLNISLEQANIFADGEEKI